MKTLQISKYLRVIKRPYDYAIYHSIFGNLCLVDDEGMSLLQSFGDNPNVFFKKHGHYDSKVIASYVANLKSRHFLVTAGYDEYEKVEKDYNSRKENLKKGYLIRALQLVTSNSCNFKCKYCFVDMQYNSEERFKFQQSQSNKQMSFEVASTAIRKTAELCKKNGNECLNIEFFGGEPLMNWSVIENVLKTFKTGYKGIEFLYSITTNGMLINEKIAKLLKRYDVTISLSFDSPNNEKRHLMNGGKTIDSLKKRLEILKDVGNYVTFNSVISKETLDFFNSKGLIDFAKTYNIEMIGLILDLDLEFYKNDKYRKLAVQAIWDTYTYAESQGIPVVGYWYQFFSQIIGEQDINLDSGFKSCPATGCKLSIEPEGFVFNCKCCSGQLGHVSDLEQALASKKYQEYALKAYRNAPECKDCEIEGFCSGVCMGSIERDYETLDAIEEGSCEIFKEITKRLIMSVDEKKVTTLYMRDQLQQRV